MRRTPRLRDLFRRVARGQGEARRDAFLGADELAAAAELVAGLVGLGLPVVLALRRAAERHPAQGAAFADVAASVAAGSSLAEAFKTRGEPFDAVCSALFSVSAVPPRFDSLARYLRSKAEFLPLRASGDLATEALAFLDAFSLLMGLGDPLRAAIARSAAALGNPSFASEAGRLKSSVDDGTALSAALAEEPRLYPELIVEASKLGEEVGMLDALLDDVIAYFRMELVQPGAGTTARAPMPADVERRRKLVTHLEELCSGLHVGMTPRRRSLLKVLSPSSLDLLGKYVARDGGWGASPPSARP